MKRKKKIGWQKYESVIEDQLTSPFLQDMLASLQPEITQEEEQETGKQPSQPRPKRYRP